MKPPQRVVWAEGMLVAPQHLQQQDLYHERLLDRRIAALAPYPWGVVSVELDAGALGADQLRLTRFVGILPDGLYAGFEAGDPECPPARPIGAHFAPTARTLEIYLGVPKELEGIPSVSDERPGTGSAAVVDTKAARARYRASSRAVSDLSGTASDLQMSFAHRNAVVLFGGESREDYDAIKIAEVVRDGSGALLNNEAYIPPVLRIDASEFLMGGVRRLLSLMMTKQRQLSGDRRQRDGSNIEFNSGDVTRFLQLSAVNSAIPMLNYGATNGEISPFTLYLMLIQVCGQLATFSAEVDVTKLPIFAHTDLNATFEELFARITQLLRTTVRETYLQVPLETSQGIHFGRLDDDRLMKALHYVLAVRTGANVPEEQLAQRLPGLCKIASRAQLPYILRSATPGVPIQVTHRPPTEIPIRAGVTYFALTLQNEHWRQILEERSLGIFFPPPFDPSQLKVELLAVPRPG
jgi:type VI secretion system protein ImpJ